MVILFSDRKDKIADEIIEILVYYGATLISDNCIVLNNDNFTLIRQYKKCKIDVIKGIAVFCNNSSRFKGLSLPHSLIGISEDKTPHSLSLIKENNLRLISCGTGNKNTVTLSSISENTYYVTLQRTLYSLNFERIEPQEIKISLNKNYTPFSVLAAVTVLLLEGIKP